MNDDTNKLKELQSAGLELLCEVDRICKKNHIKYFIDAGTLLGAVRHQGFIPWDDDVDVVFTRKNYIRFLKCVESQLDSRFELVLPGSLDNDAFFDFIPKLVHKFTSIGQNKKDDQFYNHRLNHMSLDLFVLDNANENKCLRNLQRAFLFLIYGLALGHRRSINYDKYTGFQKFIIRFLSNVGKHFSMKSIVKWYDICSRKANGHKTSKVFYSNYPIEWTHLVLNRDWFFDRIWLKFNDYRFSAPKSYDAVLSNIYGDYMTLPPAEKRIPQHLDNI